MQVVRRVLEDLADALCIPLDAQVHPQPSIGPTRVLEEVRARHGRSGAEVREHLIDPIVPGLVPQEALVGERDGTEDGLSDSGRSLHLTHISAKRSSVLKTHAGPEAGACYPWRTMPDYKEVLHERLYVRVPGTDKLRKTAAARLKHLLANGWRETDRQQTPDHVMVRFERTGHAPMKARLPKFVPEVRMERRPRRDGQGGGPRGRR